MARPIDWRANKGSCTPNAGTMKDVQCGVCGAEMSVERGKIGPTSFAEALACHRHAHDKFACPRIREDWHKSIVYLKEKVRIAEERSVCHQNPIADEEFAEVKRSAEEKINKLLDSHAMSSAPIFS